MTRAESGFSENWLLVRSLFTFSKILGFLTKKIVTGLEHLKAGKADLIPTITNIFNQILKDKKIPAVFKTDYITPVLKKGKDSKLPENYRGITGTSILGKLFEYTFINKLNYKQSDMQFGFTEGLSPMMASLIVSEVKAESIEQNSTVYLATLDSQKAFDVVDHSILLDKLFDKDIMTTPG